MNNIIFNYLLKNFFKNFFIVFSVFYCFGIILNLFEEIEFFKNSNVSILTPLLLTSIFVPSLMIKLLPFILFISSIWFMVKIRNNKELLTLKIYGYSNIKIFLILAFAAFLFGWIILFFINPVTSSLVKYYEKTKSSYAKDIDHLVTVNKNGLSIKETLDDRERFVTSNNPKMFIIDNVEIFEVDENFNLIRKILSKSADIKTYNWILKDVEIYKSDEGLVKKEMLDIYEIKSNYNYDSIVSLFNNSDTFSFPEILINLNNLITRGYNKQFLNQTLHSMMTLPFYLFLMTALASILAMHTMKRSENYKFIIIGLILTVLIYYFKDLSFALGKTDRIPLTLSIWTPVIALSLFAFIGVIQINEK